ncbi:MAG TPA: MFS transporter [Anaerolineales bacterium]|nr:MFS transporter [Anaerolineales bacterium]
MIHTLRLSLARRFPALSSRDFAIFWLGHLLSLIGTSMQNTAQPLLAYRLSGRPFDLGLIGFAITLPTFFLALPSGVLIERWDKRRAVIILQAIMMVETFCLAYLALTGLIQIWHILVLSLILGVASTFEITARQSMLIEIVGRETLPNAIALQSTAFNISRVLGPALTAPLLLAFPKNGEGWIFFLNGLSFATIIIGMFSVRLLYKAEPIRTSQSYTRDFTEGGRYIISNKSIGLIILIAAILAVFGFPIMQQFPVLAKDILVQADDTKSIVDARNSAIYTSMGLGALVAALMIALNNSQTRRGARLLLGEAAFIAGLRGIGFVNQVWQALIFIALIGWGGVTQLATMNTLIQTQIPNDLRGRVFSMYLWALQGIAPVGSLLIGWMTQTWNLPITALACGMVCLLGIGGIQVFYPAVRKSPA